MHCSKCGKENPDCNKFCEFCGSELRKDIKRAGNTKRKAKKGVIIAIAILLILISAFIIYENVSINAEYNAKIEEADRYMEDMDYESAEAAYLEAIEIEPKKDSAYVKMADVYVVQERYDDAIRILKKGQKDSGSNEIDKKYDEVYPYIAYDEFLDNEFTAESGRVNDGQYETIPKGLASRVIEDIDGDGVPELITFLLTGEGASVQIQIVEYECVENQVLQVAETIHDCEDGDYPLNDCNVFMKQNKGDWYIGIYENSQENNGNYQRMWIYKADKKSIELCDEFVIDGYYTPATLAITFDLNGRAIEDYSMGAYEDPFTDNDFRIYNEEYRTGYEMFVARLGEYGLEYMMESPEEGASREYGYRIAQGFKAFELQDETEKHVLKYEYNLEYETEGSYEYMEFYKEDYTDMTY